MTPAETIGNLLARLRALPSRLWLWEAKAKGVECALGVLFLGRPLISRAGGSTMILAEGVRIHSAVRSNPLGCFQPSVLRTMAPGARLEVGRNAGMSGAVICAGKSIEIGEGTLLGSGAMVLDNDLHLRDEDGTWQVDYVRHARPVKIGKRVFVGARAIILKGVHIGDGAVVGAGTVVTRDVPAGMVAVGNPAQVIAPRSRPE